MTERDACFHCGEMIAVEARICPFCGKSALVNLVAFGAVADGRKRYRLARCSRRSRARTAWSRRV